MKPLARLAVLCVPLGLIAWGIMLVCPPACPLVLGLILWLEIRRLWSAKP